MAWKYVGSFYGQSFSPSANKVYYVAGASSAKFGSTTVDWGSERTATKQISVSGTTYNITLTSQFFNGFIKIYEGYAWTGSPGANHTFRSVETEDVKLEEIKKYQYEYAYSTQYLTLTAGNGKAMDVWELVQV